MVLTDLMLLMMQNEENVIGWLVDMEIDKIRKFANAELNRVKYGAKSRTDNDIAASVIMSYKDESSDLYGDKNAEEDRLIRF